MKDVAEKIISEFSFLSSWEEKYEHLISMGQEMPQLDNNLKIEENLLRGCQSKVWVVCKHNAGKLYFYADSDALITRGIVALVVRLYSGATPHEIINTQLNMFSKIGLQDHLSMNRVNGLNIMIQKMKKYAVKYLKDE
tara:strand:+ start:34145 stop:34558 length:414 start_codon:yes stop_codon:yes gene_type:complete